ncbi:MAG TPA: hypothetical protein VF053_18785 [Streptosporangiales bacterium]
MSYTARDALASHTDPPPEPTRRPAPPGRFVTLVGWLLALWCLGFAVVNVVFELTGRFADGPLAAYAPGVTVMDWTVAGLKVLGAVVALLAVARRRMPVSPAALTVLVWGAFALLGVYALGNVVEAVGMATGVAGSPDQITVRNIAYVSFFLLGAAGYGVVAISYSLRAGFRRRYALLGALGGPSVIALLLVAVPALLTWLGLLPTA